MHKTVPLLRRTELTILAIVTLAGFGLRLWALGEKGLAYDEAATALMARATPAEIIIFHWNAGFEHPPFWQLTMVGWSALFGQSEFMLRLLPALAGALAVPLSWAWVRRMWPTRQWLAIVTSLLVATSPILIFYSQEARMYTIVVLLALLSLVAATALVQRPGWGVALAFIVANWLMVGYHYYSLLLIGAELLFFLLVAVYRRSAQALLWWFGAGLVAILPIAAWMLFSPGFHSTLAVAMGSGAGAAAPAAGQFLDEIWRDLSFGGIRWQTEATQWGYLLLPLAGLGLGVLFWGDMHGSGINPWSWLVAFVILLPLLFSALFFRTLAARYILFVMPALYLLVAGGVVWLWQRQPALGATGLIAALLVAVLGLQYYFGPYQKSEYREMAVFLRNHSGADDAIMLYAPRQHLLAKYYLPEDTDFYTAPAIDLPPYWPVTAPPVVPEEMDGEIQTLLQEHPALWLVITAENEVDPGEFVPKYLTAVAYKEDCWAWLDVQLCHFVSPHFVVQDSVAYPGILFNDELRLERSAVGLVDDTDTERRFLLAQLDWLAEQQPTVDYRVTLRLIDDAGTIVAQRDDFPIGTLLPPTTWQDGDAKPGYMALPLPPDLTPGTYRVVVGVYNPDTGAPYGTFTDLAKLDL